MFDDDHGAGFRGLDEDRGGVFAFLGSHPGGGFVDEEELRVLGEQHANFEPLFLAVR